MESEDLIYEPGTLAYEFGLGTGQKIGVPRVPRKRPNFHGENDDENQGICRFLRFNMVKLVC